MALLPPQELLLNCTICCRFARKIYIFSVSSALPQPLPTKGIVVALYRTPDQSNQTQIRPALQSRYSQDVEIQHSHIQRQTRNMDNRVRNVPHVKRALRLHAAVCLQGTGLVGCSHISVRVPNVDLRAGDVKLPAVERSCAREAEHAVLRRGVPCGVQPWRVCRDGAIINNST